MIGGFWIISLHKSNKIWKLQEGVSYVEHAMLINIQKDPGQYSQHCATIQIQCRAKYNTFDFSWDVLMHHERWFGLKLCRCFLTS